MVKFPAKCHCGHHEWEWDFDQEHSSHVLCHCDTCKILSGGPYTLNQIVPRSALKIIKGGEPSVYTYTGDSGNKVNCYYCPHCTTHIYHHQEVLGPDTIVARTIMPPDARKKFGVSAEIYGKDKLNWEPKIAETFDVMPPS